MKILEVVDVFKTAAIIFKNRRTRINKKFVASIIVS